MILNGSCRIRRLLSACIAFGCLAAPIRADETLVLLPAEIKLSGAEARQTLVVEQSRDGRFVGQLTEGVALESSDPKVVKIEAGEARPVGNGEATVTAKLGDRTAT